MADRDILERWRVRMRAAADEASATDNDQVDENYEDFLVGRNVTHSWSGNYNERLQTVRDARRYLGRQMKRARIRLQTAELALRALQEEVDAEPDATS